MDSPPTFSPNPFANFDPSQWSNPFSLYQNQALPWPSQYAGTPTDAYGRPIQSFLNAQAAAAAALQPAQAATTAKTPGMTLNTSQGIYSMGADLPGKGQIGQPIPLSQFAGGNYGNQGMNDIAGLASLMGMDPSKMNGLAGRLQPQAAQAAAPAGPDMSQAYLAALSNPGPVTTPGATVAPSSISYQPGNGVLQQFLANWQPVQSGPGSGFQKAFNKALRSA